MINATLEITRLHCIEQWDEHGNSEPYLWFAYFFTDLLRLMNEKPIEVFVPNIADTRALFPSVGNNQDVAIPPEIGTFPVSLEPGVLNAAMLGVIVVLLEEDDTPSSAIRAGYNEFRTAVHRELNNFFDVAGLRPPTDDEMKQIAAAIGNSVQDAIQDEAGILSIFCDNQDNAIGFSHAIFFGDALKEPPAPTNTVFELPDIDTDELKVVITSFNPLKYETRKAGHHHYQFIRPLLRLEKVMGICAGQVDQVNSVGSRLNALRSELNELKRQLAQAEDRQKSTIQTRIDELKKNHIPNAQKEFKGALGALQDCHIREALAGQPVAAAKKS
jgi:hypothetical protein